MFTYIGPVQLHLFGPHFTYFPYMCDSINAFFCLYRGTLQQEEIEQKV